MENHIRQSNLIEGIDDPTEDKKSLDAWNWFSQQELDTLTILELHRRITSNQLPKDQSGQYRRVAVWVGGHVCPSATAVPYLIQNWVDNYPNNSPKENHVRFEHIHPFIDGNGRTGRMLMWYQEVNSSREPTLIEADERDKYYEWFRVADGKGEWR